MNRTNALLACIGVVALWFIVRDNAPQAVAQQQSDPAAVSPDEDVSTASAQAKEPTLKEFMRKKLTASNQILEGLVVDDLSLVVSGSEALLKMSTAEKWRASNDIIYLQHSRDFRNSVETLRNKAKKQSIDGAALAWVDVTMSCIQCHEWVRNVVLADLSPGVTSPELGNQNRTGIIAANDDSQ